MAEARRLLAELGVGPQRPLQLRFRVNNADLPRRVALAVAAMWQPLGVRVEVVSADLKAHQQALQQGDFDVARGAWIAEDRDALSFLRLLDGRAGALNLTGYRSRAFDALLDESDGLTDPGARVRRLAAAESLAMQEQPLAPLYFYVSRRLVSPRVAGWVDNPRGVHLSRYLSVVATP
jgi:ABC-type oligopeptide transport system substrate-binding subunit